MTGIEVHNAAVLNSNLARPVLKIPDSQAPWRMYRYEPIEPIEGLTLVTDTDEDCFGNPNYPVFGYVLPDIIELRLAVRKDGATNMEEVDEDALSPSQKELYERLQKLGHRVTAKLPVDTTKVTINRSHASVSKHREGEPKTLWDVEGIAEIGQLDCPGPVLVRAEGVPMHRTTKDPGLALIDYASAVSL